MDRKILIPIGITGIVGIHAVLLAVGINFVFTDVKAYLTAGGAIYVSAILGSIAALLSGFGIQVGPLSWRTFGALAYILFAVPVITSWLVIDASGYAAVPAQAYPLLVVSGAGLLVAIGIDIALDTGWFLSLESNTKT